MTTPETITLCGGPCDGQVIDVTGGVRLAGLPTAPSVPVLADDRRFDAAASRCTERAVYEQDTSDPTKYNYVGS